MRLLCVEEKLLKKLENNKKKTLLESFFQNGCRLLSCVKAKEEGEGEEEDTQ